MDLTVTIASWNSGILLAQCLKSIYRYTSAVSFEVIVVDNNSCDNSREIVESRFPQVRLIKNSKNEGFAKAHNTALRLAGGRYAILLNQDTSIMDNCFLKMVNFLDSHPEAGALGSKIYTSLAKDKIQDSAFERFPTPVTDFFRTLEISNVKFIAKSGIIKKLARRFSIRPVNPNVSYEVDHLVGAAIMIRREVLGTVGFLDERFFMYYEETDWCLRMRKRGWKIFYLPEAEIVHLYDPAKSSRGAQKGIRRQSYLKYLAKHHSFLAVLFFKTLYLLLDLKDRIRIL